MDRMLNGVLSELLFGNVGVEIPTYLRSDNSTVLYQVDSVNIITNGWRLNGFLERNREELEQSNWLGICYIQGD